MLRTTWPFSSYFPQQGISVLRLLLTGYILCSTPFWKIPGADQFMTSNLLQTLPQSHWAHIFPCCYVWCKLINCSSVPVSVWLYAVWLIGSLLEHAGVQVFLFMWPVNVYIIIPTGGMWIVLWIFFPWVAVPTVFFFLVPWAFFPKVMRPAGPESFC